MHQGLAKWQQYLSDQSLPLLSRTKIEVQSLIDQAQLSVTQYAAPILFDACFSARIFHKVNSQREAAGRLPLTTLDSALSLLGQSAFQEFLNKAPLFEELNLSERNIRGYRRTMGYACHAALQSRDWAQQRNAMQPEEPQLAALLQNITELMLWCYGDNAMPEIEYQCYVKKLSYEQATNNVLGCGMRELGASLAEKWCLPEMAINGLISRQDDFTLATGVSLASELARLATISWYSEQTVDVIKRIAKFKGKAEGEIEHRLHMNAVQMTEALQSNDYEAPARLLPQLADESYIDPQFILQKKTEQQTDSVSAKTLSIKDQILAEVKAKKLASKKSANTDSSKDPEKEVTRHASEKPAVSTELASAIKQFKLMVADARPAHDLIEHAVKACLLSGVQRCVFVIKVPNKKVLLARYFAQASDDIAIKDLKIPLDKSHVFSLLMEKSRNLFLNDSNISKYWNMIPDSVKLAIGVKQFFAVSVFAKSHAMGLMYADKVKGDLTQQEFAQFQGICRLLSQGIVQSAYNKKK